MTTAEQYENLEWVLGALKKAQEADSDNRERAKEAKLFVHQRSGQWEQGVYERSDGKPRYQFDLVEPVVDQIAGDMERSEFDIRVTPAAAGARKEYAKTYDGLLRDIHMKSGAKGIFDRAGRSMVECGIDGWRVVQDYTTGDSFDQDLRIQRIPNFMERVWFGPHEEPDASDADYCWVLTGMTPEDFKREFPDDSDQSVDQARQFSAYFHRQDMVVVGEFLYLKPEKRTLVKMSDGSVYTEDDAFTALADELAAAGIEEVERRDTEIKVVHSRLFSPNDWLTKARETVFEDWLPVVPCYGNFEMIEDTVIYRGAVEKLMDPQRTFNYSLSREIEEGALAPRAKYWMTDKQVLGHEDTLATLNTNADPVQIYNPDERVQGPPTQEGGAQTNPGLRNISESMRQIVGMSAGMFAASMGDNPGLQSGVAIDRLQERGDIGSNKYTAAREIAQRRTTLILMKAAPRVYGQGRQIRLMREDGSHEMAVIGQRAQDSQTGEIKVLNDLTVGTYDVQVMAGPSYRSRQNETVDAITKVGAVDPTVVEMAGDVLLGNIPAPGMDDLAARKRRQLFTAGAIPPEQMTEQEQAEFQQAQQQPQQESPDMVLARAEEAKGQAALVANQVKMVTAQNKSSLDAQSLQIKQFEAQTKRMEAQIDRLTAMVEAENTGADTAVKQATAQGKELENAMQAAPVAAEVAAPEAMAPASGLDMILVESDLGSVQ